MSNGTRSQQTAISTVNRKSFHFLAGLASGLSSAILLQPADLLKTRVQQRSPSNSTSKSPGLWSTLRSIAASDAPIKHLWRGTVPSAIRTGCGSALYFGGLEILRGAVVARPGFGHVDAHAGAHNGNGKKRLSNTANLLTGAVARAAAGFVMMPITVVKVRFESTLYSYRSLWQASADIYAGNGIRGFFAGSGATAVRDAPYAGLYVLFYEAGKRRLHALAESSPLDQSNSSASINFVSGVVAAGAATALTNPFDAIKTRLQLEPARYRNMWRAAQMMIRTEGWRSLFDGLGLRMGRKGMSSALAWTVYEELVRRAEVRWLREDKGLL